MLNITIKRYSELTIDELYAVLKLRLEIFIIEQNCIYLDIDDKDQLAYHLLCTNDDGILLGSLRITDPGIRFSEISIGRVIVHKKHRREKIGQLVMQHAIDFIDNECQKNIIRISAQSYLKNFYEQFGFKQCSAEYAEDKLPHIEMVRTISF